MDEFRIKTDRLIQLAEGSKKSAETTLAWRSLQLSKAWLGELKGRYGTGTPYTLVTEVKDIPATVEVFKGDLPLAETDHLVRVNFMRQEILTYINELQEMPNELQFTDPYTFSLKALTEAKFWYGFELKRLKDENDKVSSPRV